MRKPPQPPVAQIEQRIYVIRGQKVMIDSDLAGLYEVDTRTLVQAVKRNLDRFPEDFMFQLTKREHETLISQNVISKSRGGRRTAPYAFTEHGVAMLSSVLRSKRAAQVNIAIMRAFVRIRQVLDTNQALAQKIDELAARIDKHDEQLAVVFETLQRLIQEPEPTTRKIGFESRKPPLRGRGR